MITLRRCQNAFSTHCIKRTLATTTCGPQKGDRVIVAMSGGVDSSVTARFLADHDYDLSAVYMRNWDTRDESGTDEGCEWKRDWEDVQRVCRMLDLPCEMIDLSREYWNEVFQPSLNQWETGNTPNPDVWCNRWIKFGALLERLESRKFNWLATGHYAGTSWETSFSNPRPKLMRAKDRTKDQSYYLSAIKESGLRKALFPLQNIPKTEVRELAKRYALPTAERPESMGLCFVGERRRFNDFLGQYIPPKPGIIVDLDSRREVGRHEGLWRYTIGAGAKVPGMPQRTFVAKKDPRSNTLFIVSASNHPALSVSKLKIDTFNWIWPDHLPDGVSSRNGYSARVQFRHRMSDVPCRVQVRGDGKVDIIFDEPQYAVATGQVAAVYSDDWCLGSGTISETTQAKKAK